MVVDFVRHEQHGLLLAAQELRDLFVVGTQSVFGIHQKDHRMALVKGRLDLAADLTFKDVI